MQTSTPQASDAPTGRPWHGRPKLAAASPAASSAAEVQIERLQVSAYRVPTDFPESDGTATWDATTIVVVRAHGGGTAGLGWTYGDVSSATVIESVLDDVVRGADAMRVTACWERMVAACRNLGRPGVASMAIAAVDTALWDLKARLLDLPLATLLDAVHEAVPVYGSGGFCSYPDKLLSAQLEGWVRCGIPRVKIKVGREPERDLHRVAVARAAIGPDTELYVDANGAFARMQALRFAERFAGEHAVSWFEEPVSSDDLDGLHAICERAPAGMDVAAGEYGYKLDYFERMLTAGAVTCLQADVTRCEGVTGLLRVAALCQARSLELSAHCSPALHVHPCCAVIPLRHLEYFHDHTRLERMLFDGVLEPVAGALRPDLSRPGNGLELKQIDAERFAL